MPRSSEEADETRWQLEAGYRIELFADQEAVSAQDVIDLWCREGGLDPPEAGRRVSELLMIGTDRRGGLAGICTAYLARNDQLRAELWYYRTFVSRAHRQSNIGVTLAHKALDHLERRFLTGEDRRAIGIIYEVENSGLRRHFPQAVWPSVEFAYIGENPYGDDVRVRYFAGALAPEPDA
jgi:GNAT superfamily N-acetyltransferase